MYATRASGRRFRARTTWILGAALSISATALAAEAPSSETVGVERRTGLRLDRESLLPRVSIELESFATFDRLAGPGSRLNDHVLFTELSESVRRGAERTARRTVRGYLLEAINLDQGIDHVRQGLRGSALEPGALRFHFGVHSMNPELGIERRLGQGALRLTVGTDGAAGLRFRLNRFERAEISAGFDGDDTVALRARLGF